MPNLISIGAPWDVLPAGIHQASLAEIEARYATTPHRRLLYRGFVRAANNLWQAGCHRVYLDGSFVTAKIHPSDYDGCWDPNGVDPNKVDPVLLNGTPQGRLEQKRKFYGEMFLSNGIASLTPRKRFLEYFQQDKVTGKPKGILLVKAPAALLMGGQ